uniref:Uncharacterized protein n=1 Tax=Cucumis melo TaxID=3656 RepID=A0A9I9EF70_CUCME
MDAVHSVVSTNDVILNRSCEDMGVGASYKNECGFILGRLKLVKTDKIAKSQKVDFKARRSFETKKKLRTTKSSTVHALFVFCSIKLIARCISSDDLPDIMISIEDLFHDVFTTYADRKEEKNKTLTLTLIHPLPSPQPPVAVRSTSRLTALCTVCFRPVDRSTRPVRTPRHFALHHRSLPTCLRVVRLRQ